MNATTHSLDPQAEAPWLSIMVPVFNVEAYLTECLESIAAQADAGVEILALDDASTDCSMARLDELQTRWKGRFKLLQHERNRGPSAARNNMLAAARGEYLWFVDSDDVMLPGAIAELQAVIAQHRPDLVMCDFQMLGETTRRRTFSGTSARIDSDPSALLTGMMVAGRLHVWSKISHRSVWDAQLRFPDGRYFEDIYLSPRLALRTRSYYHVPRAWIAYRRRAGSIVAAKTLTMIDDWATAFSGFKAEMQRLQPGMNAEARFQIALACAKNFINAVRFLAHHRGPETAQRLTQYLQHFEASTPLTIGQLGMAYLRRGWLRRWVQLRYWVFRARRARV